MRTLLLSLLLAGILGPQAPNEARGIHDAVLKELFKGAVPASYMVGAEYRKMYPPDDRVWLCQGGQPAGEGSRG